MQMESWFDLVLFICVTGVTLVMAVLHVLNMRWTKRLQASKSIREILGWIFSVTAHFISGIWFSLNHSVEDGPQSPRSKWACWIMSGCWWYESVVMQNDRMVTAISNQGISLSFKCRSVDRHPLRTFFSQWSLLAMG